MEFKRRKEVNEGLGNKKIESLSQPYSPRRDDGDLLLSRHIVGLSLPLQYYPSFPWPGDFAPASPHCHTAIPYSAHMSFDDRCAVAVNSKTESRLRSDSVQWKLQVWYLKGLDIPMIIEFASHTKVW